MDLAGLHFPVGMAIGIAAAAPVGPVNLLVVQRALSRHRTAAMIVGFGGAVGDAVFASVAAFGLAAASLLLDEYAAAIRIAGGLVMLAFAVVVWRAAPRLNGDRPRLSSMRMALVVFGMTLTNPATLLFFLGSFGAVGFVGIGSDTTQHFVNSTSVVAGVFAGSMLWWLALSTVARALRGRITNATLIVINHATAGVLALFGFGAIIAGITG
jgi:threonine/homoserine/homoserine lactone efflux protein